MWGADEKTAVDMWLNPCLSPASSKGPVLALCRPCVGGAAGPSVNEAKLLIRCGAGWVKKLLWSLRKRNLLSSGLIIWHSFRFTNNSFITCKALTEAGAETLIGDRMAFFMACEQRGHITFKTPILIYKLTLFLTSLLSLLARGMLAIKPRN